MNSRKSLSIILAVLMLITSISAMPLSAQAKAGAITKKAVSLKSGKVYTKYDITNDGKADRIKAVFTPSSSSSSGNGEWKVTINGKKKKTFENARGGKLYLITMKKKQSYLILESAFFGGNDLYIYKYKKGKFKKAYNYTLGEGVFDYAKPTYVSSSGFTVRITSGKHQRALFRTDEETLNEYSHLSFDVKYVLKSGKIKLKSKYAKYSNFACAEFDFYTSSTAKNIDYAYHRVREGDYLEIDCIYLSRKPDKVALRIYNDEDEKFMGWLTDANGFSDDSDDCYNYFSITTIG